jgi:hypothetical protein
VGIFRPYTPVVSFIKNCFSLVSQISQSSLIGWFNSLQLTTNFLQDIIALEAVLIGVAIPISLQVVLSMVQEYDRDISKFFKNEWLYKAQYGLLFSNIIISISVRFFDFSNNYFLLFLLIWSGINMLLFYLFVRLVHDYVTDTDKVILKKVWENAKNVFKK